MNKLGLAIAIASEAFKSTVDKGGKPYILHCLRVMQTVDKDDEDLQIIAILHDLIEDTKYELDDLMKLGFSMRVIKALELLSHIDENVSYDEYIKNISTNKDATKVKLRDIEDNSNITRLKGLRKKDFDRLEKYSRAYVYLNN